MHYLQTVLLIIFQTGYFASAKMDRRTCDDYIADRHWADFEMWGNGFRSIWLCPLSACDGQIEIWAHDKLLMSARFDDQYRPANLKLSLSHFDSFKIGVFTVQISIILIRHQCFFGMDKEFRFAILLYENDWLDRSVLRIRTPLIDGNIEVFKFRHPSSTKHSDGQMSPDSLESRSSECWKFNQDLSSALLSKLMSSDNIVKCNVRNFSLAISMSRSVDDSSVMGYRAVSFYNLSYYDKLSLISQIQQSVWNQSNLRHLPPVLKRVILSADDNPTYAFCLPIAALFWQRIVGFNVSVFLVGRAWDRHAACVRGPCLWMRVVRGFLDELGAESDVLGADTHPSGLVAQVSRLYAAARSSTGSCGAGGDGGAAEDEYLLVSDADLLPLAAAPFLERDWSAHVHLINAYEGGTFPPPARPEGLPLPSEKDPAAWNSFWAAGSGRVGMFPMSHVGARAAVWRAVMGLPDRPGLRAWWPGADGTESGKEGGMDEALTAWIAARLDADRGGEGVGRGGYSVQDEERSGAWWYDQRLLSARLHGWAGFPGRAELVRRDTGRDRVDRARWGYSAGAGRVFAAGRRWSLADVVWGRPPAVDAHVPLPLSGEGAWQAALGLLRSMLPRADVDRLAAYRARFLAAHAAA